MVLEIIEYTTIVLFFLFVALIVIYWLDRLWSKFFYKDPFAKKKPEDINVEAFWK